MIDAIKALGVKVKAWFTPARRKATYKFVIALYAFLFAVGVITPEFVEQFKVGLTTAGGLVTSLTALLALVNVNPE